jgi:glyoxylate reductase
MPEYVIAWADAQPAEEVAFAQSFLPDGFVIRAPEGGTRQELIDLVAHADAIMTQHVVIDANLIASAGQVKLIQKYGGREDGINVPAAIDAGVPVAVMPLRGCIAVAELAMTLVLALSKQLIEAHRSTVNGLYRDRNLTPTVSSQKVFAFQWMGLPGLLEVYGKTLGIIGFGEIGTEISKRARAFGMQVLYHKREPLAADIEQRLNVTFADRDTLLSQSDFVVLSAPHTAETERLIGERELGLMRDTAFLVNISRGGLVDEQALVNALRRKDIAGAGLDVYVQEPVPADNPLLQLDSVILTPHIGGGTGGARQKQMSDVVGNIVQFAQFGRLDHRIA